ncbi:MAG: DUF421 domain-containing protein [Luteimonas sp.]
MDTDFIPLDWERMLLGLAPPSFYLEIMLRIVMLVALLLVVVRALGKRGQQNLSPMQQMLMIALGSAAGDVMLYPEVSIGSAATVLVGVTLLTIGIDKAATRFPPVRDYLESHPTILMRDGKIDLDAMRQERTTRRELYANLRQQGAVSLSQVELAILEVTGEITVILNDSKPSHRDLVEYLWEGATAPEMKDHALGANQQSQ